MLSRSYPAFYGVEYDDSYELPIQSYADYEVPIQSYDDYEVPMNTMMTMMTMDNSIRIRFDERKTARKPIQ